MEARLLGLVGPVLRHPQARNQQSRTRRNAGQYVTLRHGLFLGGFESLIIPFDCRDYRTVTNWDPSGLALRLQIGLEDIEDLKRDLRIGLDRLNYRAS